MTMRTGRVALGVLIVVLALATRPGPATAGDHAPLSRTSGGMIGDPAAADALMRAVELTATDTAVYDSFGWAVAVSKDGATAVIGAPGTLENSTKRGAAYVFARDGDRWNQTQTLAPSDPRSGNTFGWAVAVSGAGDAAVIGQYGDAAYVFARPDTSLIQRQQLADDAPGSANHFTHFGSAVAMSADRATVLIGAPTHGDRGAAYVFSP